MIYENAKELVNKIKSKEISSVELLEAYLKQVEKVNPKINAVVVLDAERALEKAKKADQTKNKTGLLFGLPMTIKDAFEVEGIVSTGAILRGKIIYLIKMLKRFKDLSMREQLFSVKLMFHSFQQICKVLMHCMEPPITPGILKELQEDLQVAQLLR